MQLSSSIFKAYDIRGIVPSTINEDMARGLGRAFGTMAMQQGERTVAVGRDGRLSGPGLADALMAGLQDAGVAVIDVGMVTTPMHPVQEWYPGHRQPQPQRLQRLQDGAGWARHLWR